MTWARQVLHVAMKDARQSRWLVAAYVAVVVISILSSLDANRPLQSYWTYLIILLGWIGAGTTVQNDPPLGPNARWATQPLHPTAVATSKVLFVLALTCAAVAGELTVTIVRYGAVAHHLDRILDPAVGLTTIFVIATILAGLTSQLRTFLILAFAGYMLFTYAAGIIVANTYGVHESTAAERAHTAIRVLASVGAYAALMHLYHTRERLRGTFLTVFVIFGALLLGSKLVRVGLFSAAGEVRVREATISEFPKPSLRIWYDPQKTDLDHGFNVWASAESDSNDVALMIEEMRAELATPTGTRTILPLSDSFANLNYASEAYIGQSTLKIQFARNHSNIHMVLTEAQRDAFLRGDSRIFIHARVSAFAPKPAVRAPLSNGASKAAAGERITVAEAVHETDGVHLRLIRSSINDCPRDRFQTFVRLLLPEAVLINDSLREAVLLSDRNGETRNEPLVLPGAFAQTRIADFTNDRPGSAPTPRDWLANAVVATIEWQHVGSVQTSTEVVTRPMPERQ